MPESYPSVCSFLTGRTFSGRRQWELSTIRPVSSGVPQGSVLGPTLFLVHINDLLDNISSPCLLYADDIKIWRVLNDKQDPDLLQDDLDRHAAWSKTWQIPINREKSKYLHIDDDRHLNAYHVQGFLLDTSKQEKDLGVVVSSSLKTSAHTDAACFSAKRMLGVIRRSFCNLNQEAFRVLYASFIRSRLEYAGVVTFPCTVGEMDTIERVQRAATRLVDGTAGMDYEDILKTV